MNRILHDSGVLSKVVRLSYVATSPILSYGQQRQPPPQHRFPVPAQNRQGDGVPGSGIPSYCGPHHRFQRGSHWSAPPSAVSRTRAYGPTPQPSDRHTLDTSVGNTKTVLSSLPWGLTPRPSVPFSRLVSDTSGILSLPLVPMYARLSTHEPPGGLWMPQEDVNIPIRY